MAQGFDGNAAIKEQYKGWGSVTPQGIGIGIKEMDNTDVDIGFVQNRRENKVRGARSLNPDLVTNDFANPTGGFQHQPRTVELIPLAMSHYQMFEGKGTTVTSGTVSGTWLFAPANRTPDAVGSQWGTMELHSDWGGGGDENAYNTRDFYPLTLEVGYGTVEGANAVTQLQFRDGFVDTQEWTQSFDGDLMVSHALSFKGTQANFEHMNGGANFATNYKSTSLRFAAWNGTLTVAGTSNTKLDIEEWSMTTTNKGEGRGRIGAYGFGRYSFNDFEVSGGMRSEFKDFHLYRKVLSGSVFAMTMRWEAAGGDDDWIQVQMPNVRFRPVTPNIDGGDSNIQVNWEYEAFGTDVGGEGTPAVIVSLHAGWGTQIMSIQQGTGISLT